jgi:hypothetical protein
MQRPWRPHVEMVVLLLLPSEVLVRAQRGRRQRRLWQASCREHLTECCFAGLLHA